MSLTTDLSDFLVNHLTAEEVRRLVESVAEDPRLVGALPGLIASPQDVASSAVNLLQQKHLLTPTFFVALERVRPGIAPAIRALAARFASAPRHALAGDQIGILHVTDLHVGQSDASWLWPRARDAVERDLAALHDACGPWDVVLFTGDLTNRGLPEEFDALDPILDSLLSQLHALGSEPTLLAVPGNHDLVRPDDDDAIALALRTRDRNILKLFWKTPDNLYRQRLAEAFQAWSTWWERRRADQPNLAAYTPGPLPGDYCATVQVRDRKLGVAGVNSTFLHLWEGNLERKLSLHPRQLFDACDRDPAAWSRRHDAAVLMTHHPSNWLDKDGLRALQGEIYQPETFDLHLCGHVHEQGMTTQSIFGAEDRRELPGGALFGRSTWTRAATQVKRTHGYSAIQIRFHPDKRTLQVWPREGVVAGDHTWKLQAHSKFTNLDNTGGTRLQSLRASPRAPVRSAAPRSSPTPTEPVEAPTHIELLLILMNRSEQWRQLRAALLAPTGHFVASVTGSVEQDLHLFCERVQKCVNERGGLRHHVHQVHLRRSGVAARSRAEIGNRFVHAANATRGDLPGLLRTLTEPTLFIVHRDHEPLHALTDSERDDLVGFLAEDLPLMLKKAGDIPPVRLLVPIQHAIGEGAAELDVLCLALQGAMKTAAASHKLPHLPLPELTLPTWSEVKTQLIETFRITDPQILEACCAAYTKARRDPNTSYQALALLLEAIIKSKRPPEHP